ncbi:unnamed protein product, partial [marine sediment metagenome]
GYSALEKINPGVIMVSISPFGQTGPYKDYKAPDIVAWATGGVEYVVGDADRPPVRISHHSQAHLHAAASGAVGALAALYYREMAGYGQQVDVSIQECITRCSFMFTSAWDMMKINLQRGGLTAGIRMTRTWPCKDGYVMWFIWSGPQAKRFNTPFIEWMAEEGIADDVVKGFDWDEFDLRTEPQELIDRFEALAGRFFLKHTKAELMQGAFKHRVMLFPISTSKDILESAQLAAREFWVQLEHPELGTSI